VFAEHVVCSRADLLHGKRLGRGQPAANEMMSGRSVSLSSSRIAELVIRCVRCANRCCQGVLMVSSLGMRDVAASGRRSMSILLAKIERAPVGIGRR
jgi:hypothetical protein